MKSFTGAMGSPIKRVWNEDQMDWNLDFYLFLIFNFYFLVCIWEREFDGTLLFASDGASPCPDGFGAHSCFVDFAFRISISMGCPILSSSPINLLRHQIDSIFCFCFCFSVSLSFHIFLLKFKISINWLFKEFISRSNWNYFFNQNDLNSLTIFLPKNSDFHMFYFNNIYSHEL